MKLIILIILLCLIIWLFKKPWFWIMLGVGIGIAVIIHFINKRKEENSQTTLEKNEFKIDTNAEWYCPECDYKNKSGHICKSCGYEAKAVTEPKHIIEYSAEALGVMAMPVRENTAPSSEPHIKHEFLPYSIDGMPYSYSYEDVHICIIKERMPDMNKIKECAYENATVTVKLEPENPYDNEAVALYTANDIHMGYLYRNRLKDMAYDYLKKGLPIRARITKIEDEDIYINIAFYSPKKEIKYTNEISFTLISRSEEMQYNLSYAEGSDELDYYFDDIKEKFVFSLDYGDIGYAPQKYDELLDKIVHYNCKIIKLNELDSGNFSAKISIQYAD